jgi:daunosaminyl-N,N-dimethyltransferase/N-dimethyltransferase
MYAEHAELYDLIYHMKDYAAEAEVVRGALAGLGIGPGSRLLDAACGTGSHLVHLAEDFVVSGFDRQEAMLEIARGKVPTATLWQADLRDFQVDEPVDAAICLFSAIGYLLDEASLSASARRFAAAVRPGGVVLIEPWVAPEDYVVGRPHLQVGPDDPDLRIARATVADQRGDHSIMDMHWLVARKGRPVLHFVDRHQVWLCPREVMRRVFAEAGFDADFVDASFTRGRTLLVARRR